MISPMVVSRIIMTTKRNRTPVFLLNAVLQLPVLVQPRFRHQKNKKQTPDALKQHKLEKNTTRQRSCCVWSSLAQSSGTPETQDLLKKPESTCPRRGGFGFRV